jgi:hypothetical protein
VKARETADRETPARFATSAAVTNARRCNGSLIGRSGVMHTCAECYSDDALVCNAQPNEVPATAAAQAPTAEAEAPPMEVHEASAQCWMQVDKTRAEIDARAKLVDKCIDDKMQKSSR